MGNTFLTRRYSLSCMHTLYSEHISKEENARVFGKCASLHGHDYRIEVTVVGNIDQVSGLICDRDNLDSVIQWEIINRFHKTDLNTSFKSTTGEDLAREFYELLEPKLLPIQLARIRLQETPKNFFTWGNAELFPHQNIL